jgi:hypothetical protein
MVQDPEGKPHGLPSPFCAPKCLIGSGEAAFNAYEVDLSLSVVF